MSQSQLMTNSEMRERYQKREDPFDLTIEKWVRIRQFLDTASTLSDFQQLFEALYITVPFCFKYQIKACQGCPLEKIGRRGKGKKLFKVMGRLIQSQLLANLAGSVLPKEPLISGIDNLLQELERAKAKTNGPGHLRR